MESYVERPPLPGLAGVVRTVWIQRTGEAAYVQRHLPTGGVEIHFPIGGQPQLPGRQAGPGDNPYLDTTRLTCDTGFRPAFDIAAAVADYVAWRAGNSR